MLFLLGRASYLSANICEEFISLIAKHVNGVIVSEITEAEYFSISVDSSPDITHTDQLSFCIRYVLDDSIFERFLAFIPIHGHSAENLFDTVLNFLKDNQIDIKYCRGQSYDNENSMSGKYSGLQARIKQVNRHATYIPCSAHSLNLVAQNSVTHNAVAVQFFNIVGALYDFFVDSTWRWKELEAQLKDNSVVKRPTGTRWSAKHDAIRALHSSLPTILIVLNSFLSESSNQKDESKATAKGLIKKLCQFDNIFMLVFWKNVLSKMNRANLALQSPNLTLCVVVKLYRSLISFLEDLRTQFDSVFDESKDLFEKVKSAVPVDIIRTRSINFETYDPSNHEEKYRNTVFLPIIESLLANLNKRNEVYCNLEDNFAFLSDFDK